MELNKTKWLEEDKCVFNEYLKSFGQPEKTEWSKRILNS